VAWSQVRLGTDDRQTAANTMVALRQRISALRGPAAHSSGCRRRRERDERPLEAHFAPAAAAPACSTPPAMSKEPSETTASVTGPPPSVHGSDATRAPRMSRVRAVVLVLTVTLGMMQNVRRSPITAPAHSWARGFSLQARRPPLSRCLASGVRSASKRTSSSGSSPRTPSARYACHQV
jgi:hypothetical protein